MSTSATTVQPAARRGAALVQQEGLVGAAIVVLSLVIGLINPGFFGPANVSVMRGGLIVVTKGQWIMNMPPEFFISQSQYNLGGWLPIPVLVMVIVVAV